VSMNINLLARRRVQHPGKLCRICAGVTDDDDDDRRQRSLLVWSPPNSLHYVYRRASNNLHSAEISAWITAHYRPVSRTGFSYGAV